MRRTATVISAKRCLGAVRGLLFAMMLAAVPPGAHAVQASYPQPREGEFLETHFHFRDGSVLPELRIHFDISLVARLEDCTSINYDSGISTPGKSAQLKTLLC